MLPFQSLIINRVINYAIAPVFTRTVAALQEWWGKLSPETRHKIYQGLVSTLWPVCALVDNLRWAVVRAYVIDGQAAAAVWDHSRAVDSIVFTGKPRLSSHSWNGKDRTTHMFLFPVVLILCPVFWAVDMARCVAADKLRPGQDEIVNAHFDQVWQNMFASI